MAVFVAWWPGIVAHHLGIILFMAVGVLSPTRAGQGDGLIIIGLLTEFSSIFVAARGFLARVGLRESKWYIGVSIAMVVSFFIARILLVPLVIVLYSRQVPMKLWNQYHIHIMSQIGIPTLQGFRSIPLKVCENFVNHYIGLIPTIFPVPDGNYCLLHAQLLLVSPNASWLCQSHEEKQD